MRGFGLFLLAMLMVFVAAGCGRETGITGNDRPESEVAVLSFARPASLANNTIHTDCMVAQGEGGNDYFYLDNSACTKASGKKGNDTFFYTFSKHLGLPNNVTDVVGGPGLNTLVLDCNGVPDGAAIRQMIVSAFSAYLAANSKATRVFDVAAAAGLANQLTFTVKGIHVIRFTPLISGGAFSVPEVATPGTGIGMVQVSGAASALAFVIVGGDPQGLFSIDPFGIIRVQRSLIGNWPSNPDFALSVRVTDGYGWSGVAQVMIDILDLQGY